ncbi:hypothetical protein M885DRAFT_622633 [Pelagophyceae sp. CCMP2097]|nr:hypothetical protein M885DRAFT_622633 [Pelagophyceae sp. CCMP2097]
MAKAKGKAYATRVVDEQGTLQGSETAAGGDLLIASWQVFDLAIVTAPEQAPAGDDDINGSQPKVLKDKVAACKQLAAEFQDRLFDELMPEKKPKEAPAIVEGVSLADGTKARLPASEAEWVRLVQKHVDKGNAEAQLNSERNTFMAMQERRLFWRFVTLKGMAGVAQSYDEAVKLYRLAASQGYTEALFNLGACHAHGRGLAHSYDEAVKCYRLAAAQDHAGAIFDLGAKGHAGAAAAVDEVVALLAAARAA